MAISKKENEDNKDNKADIEIVAGKDADDASIKKVVKATEDAADKVSEIAKDGLNKASELGHEAAEKASEIGYDAAEAASGFASSAKESAGNFITAAPAVIMGMFASIKETTPPVHPAGYPFVAIFFVIAFMFSTFSTTLGWIGFIATAWCLYFFRNPKRTVPQGDSLIVSPADGRVQMIADVVPPAELELGDEERTRVSIFLNVFDVHVQRTPAVGEIVAEHYHEGLFLNASLDKASEDNERQLVTVQMKSGEKVGFVQIAGLIARRIICDLKVGQKVDIGDLYGLIRFGSRVDVFLPKGVKPLVNIGQRAVGGETIIADLENPSIERNAIEKA